ncbi:transmembrane protein 179B isoform X1 [Centroberyx affinis]|uniref:transmembrane protein 179B isoform X1 n=1 Tax=Centroberyx affinis TaxID=166261 RepID=UPI003A5C2180
MMALPWLLLVELALYASCFVCGIVTAASLTISQGSLGGLCMLYGSVSYNATTAIIGAQSSSPTSLCYFVSAISVLVAVVCFSLSLYWLYTCCIDGEIRRERMWMNLTLGVCAVFLFFLLITGCMLKIGRDSLCSSVTQNIPNITRCEEAQSKKWASPLNGAQFYTSLHKAETAVWVNFFFWLIIGVLVFIQRGQSSGFKIFGRHLGGTGAGSGDPGDPGETEPIFNRPANP